METYDPGKKVFFLYPPHDFSKNIITRLFRGGYEIYKFNSTSSVLKVLTEFPDSLLFINTDYPYKKISFTEFNDQILNQDQYKNIMVYSIFSESVSYGDKVRDYIALNRAESDVLQDLERILKESGAHGKREYVRYGNFNEQLSTISYTVDNIVYNDGMHDISPKALSFSSVENRDDLVGKYFTNMKLKVGVYEITVNGKIELSRMMGGKKIYIAVFDLNDTEKENVFNFIFTSLEMSMDKIIQKMKEK